MKSTLKLSSQLQSHTTTARTGRRRANYHQLTGSDDDDDDPPLHDEDDTLASDLQLAINQVVRKRARGNRPRLNKATWDGLATQDQTTWDQLSDEAKRQIITYAGDRATRIQANVHSTTTSGDSDDAAEAEHTAQDDPDEDAATIAVHNVTTKAVADAHPGDVRRLLATKNKEGSLQAGKHGGTKAGSDGGTKKGATNRKLSVNVYKRTDAPLRGGDINDDGTSNLYTPSVFQGRESRIAAFERDIHNYWDDTYGSDSEDSQDFPVGGW